jgi:hypothetical protein
MAADGGHFFGTVVGKSRDVPIFAVERIEHASSIAFPALA